MKLIKGPDSAGLIEKLNALEAIAKELNCTLAQLAIAWCIKNPNVSTVITGASRPEQVEENLKALAVVPKITSQVDESIEKILANKPTPQDTFGR